MSGVKGGVKSLLAGSVEEQQQPPQLSLQVREHFNLHARKDETTGELYMTENEFINAIAPSHGDYVRVPCFLIGFFRFYSLLQQQ